MVNILSIICDEVSEAEEMSLRDTLCHKSEVDVLNELGLKINVFPNLIEVIIPKTMQDKLSGYFSQFSIIKKDYSRAFKTIIHIEYDKTTTKFKSIEKLISIVRSMSMAFVVDDNITADISYQILKSMMSMINYDKIDVPVLKLCTKTCFNNGLYIKSIPIEMVSFMKDRDQYDASKFLAAKEELTTMEESEYMVFNDHCRNITTIIRVRNQKHQTR